MATIEQYDAVRYDFAADPTNMQDPEIEKVYARAAAKYPSNGDAIEAWVRILVCRNLMAQAAKLNDYKANQSQEWLSQILPNIEKLMKIFVGDLDFALNGTSSPIRFGRLNRYIPRMQEIPNDVSSNILADDEIFFFGGDVSRPNI